MERTRYAYWVFYSRDDGEIYAYSDDKVLVKSFQRLRKKSLFFKKKVWMTSEDLRSLHECYPGSLLRWHKYESVGLSMDLAVTLCEDTTVNSISTMKTTVDLPVLIGGIPPTIFVPKIRDFLISIGYGKLYNMYANNGPEYELTPDFLLWFVHVYGNTIDWKGGGMCEIISVLHYRRNCD